MNYSCKWSVGTPLKLLLTKPGNTNPSLPLNSAQGINTAPSSLAVTGAALVTSAPPQSCKSDSTASQSCARLLNRSWESNPASQQQMYCWRWQGGSLVLSLDQPGTRAHALQPGLRLGGAGLAPLWTYALSSEINHSLYHSCSIWSHNHYPTAGKEMKPLIARGAGLSVQSRKVFIKFSFEKWFFMAGLAGHVTQKLDLLQQLSTTHPQHTEPMCLESL